MIVLEFLFFKQKTAYGMSISDWSSDVCSSDLNIDVFDIEVDAIDPDRFIDVVAALEPTFGGINLEDIKAPECFEIERRLRERMNIPVFHDDDRKSVV